MDVFFAFGAERESLLHLPSWIDEEDTKASETRAGKKILTDQDQTTYVLENMKHFSNVLEIPEHVNMLPYSHPQIAMVL